MSYAGVLSAVAVAIWQHPNIQHRCAPTASTACRQPVEEAQVVQRADEANETAQPPSTDGREAHPDPLSDSHPHAKQSSAPVDVTAERQARRERALKAQQEQEAAKVAAAEESESEYETVRASHHS